MESVNCLVGMQCLPAAQGPTAGNVFDTTAIRDHTLLLQQIIKVSSIKFGEAILLGDVDLKRKNRKKIVKLSSKFTPPKKGFIPATL